MVFNYNFIFITANMQLLTRSSDYILMVWFLSVNHVDIYIYLEGGYTKACLVSCYLCQDLIMLSGFMLPLPRFNYV